MKGDRSIWGAGAGFNPSYIFLTARIQTDSGGKCRQSGQMRLRWEPKEKWKEKNCANVFFDKSCRNTYADFFVCKLTIFALSASFMDLIAAL